MPTGNEEIDFRRYADLDRDGDEYVLRYDGPYEGRPVFREVGVSTFQPGAPPSFGDGVSTPIDAGQWLKVELMNKGLAELGLRNAHPDDYGVIARAWEEARGAVDEIMKFLPPGADEVPVDSLWTDDGRQAALLVPAGLHRARLVAAREDYVRRRAELPGSWPHPVEDEPPFEDEPEPPLRGR